MLGIISICFSVHKEMTIQNCKEYIQVTYEEFVSEFNKHIWESDEQFKTSLFNHKDNSEIHASIFKFNGLGYVCKNKREYKKVNEFIRNVLKYKSVMLVNKKDAENRLTKALKSICNQLNIPLEYKDKLGDAAGHILYHSLGGRLLLDNARIEILNEYINEPYVLAHELGHYMAIKQREDRTEQGADSEAYKLCCSILTESEQIALYNDLKISFHQ